MELPEAFKAKALSELREDDIRKRQALEQFREWIGKQGHIDNCRMDDSFLLRFLRVKKYSNAQAFNMLGKFLATSQTFPHWFCNLTLDNGRMRELYDSGFIIPLKERDRNGSRVILIRASKLDTQKFTFSDVLKIINFVVFTLLEEQETQIAGFVYVIDHKDITMDYISLFSLNDMRNYLKCIQQAMPCRQKQAIFVNLPAFAVALTDFGKSFVSSKLKERALFYKDIKKLGEHVDLKILPQEFGGQTSIEEAMKSFEKIYEGFKGILKRTDEQHIDLKFTEINENVDSFRKLEVD